MDKHEEVSAIADRLIDAFVNRAGSEDARNILTEYADKEDDGDRQVVALARLVMKLAERAADATTVYDIWSPERPIVPEKINRLTALVFDAGIRWGEESKKH
ncbi:hypothetical protein [Microbacterium hydrocarbonoxydans]|uniref:hypothetical protein n=1 Tax=Microbacterium hydrocarbonoxydans TaxID=273678 RepID=UPI001269B2C4|nr:hypothetical protein [Microbacterium hydrocarbonoxydans]